PPVGARTARQNDDLRATANAQSGTSAPSVWEPLRNAERSKTRRTGHSRRTEGRARTSFEPHHGETPSGQHFARKPVDNRRQALREPNRQGSQTLRITRGATVDTQSGTSGVPDPAFWGTSADGAASDVGETSRAAMSSGPASRLTGMETERVTASTTIEAAPEAVFAVLADPSAHADIDGTGWVRESLDDDRITAAGQVFRMAMYHPNHPDKDYKIANLVEVFDEPRAIAWKPGTEAAETGELSFGGWTWRYDLEPAGSSVTTVTLTYDWSAVPPEVRE